MSDAPKVQEVRTPEYGNVSVEHPTIVESIKKCKERGLSKEQAQKVIGMPMEVIDRHYR